MRDLLSHQSGFTYNKYDGYAPVGSVPTLLQVLSGDSPATTPPTDVQFAPGSRYDMAAENYAVIQQVITDVARRPFDELMQGELFVPLGMTASTFALAPRTDIAAGHSETGALIVGGAWAYPESTASGLWTTPRDFANALAETTSVWGEPGRHLPKAGNGAATLETVAAERNRIAASHRVRAGTARKPNLPVPGGQHERLLLPSGRRRGSGERRNCVHERQPMLAVCQRSARRRGAFGRL